MRRYWSKKFPKEKRNIDTSDRVDFSDVEIDVFFGLSDVNGDGTISTDVSSSFTVLKRGGAVYVFYLSPNSTAGE